MPVYLWTLIIIKCNIYIYRHIYNQKITSQYETHYRLLFVLKYQFLLFFSSRVLQNKSFWPSITENQKVSSYEFLCSAFESAAYEKSLARALDIPTCRVIPYFKFYLDKLKLALSSSTDFSFTSASIEEICAMVSWKIHIYYSVSCMKRKIYYYVHIFG